MSFKDPTVYHAGGQISTSVVPCETHNQKSLRNAFHSSSNSTDATRCFQSEDVHTFTWEECLVVYYKRDLDNADSVTKLNHQCVYPNIWNKMRIGYSLRPFH